MLPEPIAVTLLVIEALDNLDVPYFIGGSLASAIYGVARTTIDADLIADLRSEHAIPLAKELNKNFYVSIEAIQDAVKRRGSFNVIHFDTIFKVDIFIMKTRPFDLMQFERRVKQVISNDPPLNIYFASTEDTILAKLEWFRQGGEVSERQWKDVLGVLKTQLEKIDITYLKHWSVELGLSDLMERALREAVK